MCSLHFILETSKQNYRRVDEVLLSPYSGPDVLLLSARGQGAVRQQPRREAPDPTATLPAAAT